MSNKENKISELPMFRYERSKANVLMKLLFSALLFLITVSIHAQQSSNNLLPPDIIKAVKPSVHILNEIQKMKSFYSTFTDSLKHYHNKNGSTAGFSFDFSQYLSWLRNIIMSDDKLFLRQYAAIQLANITMEGCRSISRDSILVKMCLQILKPEDIIWRINPENSIIYYGNIYSNIALKAYHAKEKLPFTKEGYTEKQKADWMDYLIKKGIEYRQSIFDKNPDKTVKVTALIGILDLCNLFKKYDKVDYYYKILESEFSDLKTDQIKNAIIEYNPEGRLRVGQTVPDFNLQVLDSTKTISSKMLKGKYYLIQFWATWCGPCLAEMPGMRSIYNKHKNDNFTIVSVSFDQSSDIVRKYWNKEGSMPWYNVILEKGFEDSAVKYFGITSVPKIILVSPEGKILADDRSELSETINGFLDLKK